MVRTEDIISTIQSSENLNKKLMEKLMRKFELNKKIYIRYDDEFMKPLTSDEISKELYRQLAVSFCLQALIQKDVRFYNTALKISDSIGIQLPNIKC